MEWVAVTVVGIIAVVLAFLAGRKKGNGESQATIDTLTSENRRLTKENSELSAQVDLYGPKKKSGVSASTKIKDALDSISVPSFGGSKASRSKPSASRSSSKSSGYKSSYRSSDDSSGFLGGIIGASIFSGGDSSGGGGGYGGDGGYSGGDSGGGGGGGGSCD